MNNILKELGKLQDKRSNKGKRYELKSIVALILFGYMRGCDSLAKIYRLGKNLGKREKKKLGFKGATPSHPTLTTIMKMIDIKELGQIVRGVIKKNEYEHIALDGKSIKSTYDTAEGLLHLVSAYAVEACGVLSQIKSELAGGEIFSAESILEEIDIEGKIVTGDAMFAQPTLCKKVVEKKGDFLFKVKKNKKHIYWSIEQQFNRHNSLNLPIATYNSPATKGHGRIEQRVIEVIEVKDKSLAYLPIAQIARITKHRYTIKNSSETSENLYIITSLSKEKASPESLLSSTLKHWAIENKLHRTRDFNFSEDTSNVASHASHQNCCHFKNLAIFLLNKIHNSITLAIEIFSLNTTLFFRRI